MLSPRNAERAAELAARFPSVRVATDNQQVVDRSDVVVVCLLPNHAAEVLAGLQFRADHAVVSAIAGFPIGQLAGLVAPATDIARSIPLPAVATRGSLTPVHPATPAATGLYDRLGGSMEIDDELAFESVVTSERSQAGCPTGASRQQPHAATSPTPSPHCPASSSHPGPTSQPWRRRTPRPAGSTSSSHATSKRREPTMLCRPAWMRCWQGSLRNSNQWSAAGPALTRHHGGHIQPGGSCPTRPSTDSRMRSAWPLWRAYSSIMLSRM